MSNPLIQFDNFSLRYKAQAEPTLYNISLTIHEGEKVLICGPSGCGKSTMVHCLNGLIPASYDAEITGSLTIDGKSYKDLDIFSLSKLVGTVLQDSDGQFIGLSVGEDIAFALENDCVEQKSMQERVEAAAREVGMEDFLSHAPHSLSGGQKQRVSLAGVMVDNVRMLLFDEPLANLDPAAGKNVIELIDDIHRKTGDTVIIIEHRLEDVLHRDVDRIILMGEGRIVADMTPDQLLSADLLRPAGIREPLYVTALRYAGIEVTEDIHPGRMETLSLPEESRQKLRDWFRSIPADIPANTRDSVLEARNIFFSYDSKKTVLQNIDFTVKKGEMLAIAGRNGAGKSTFCKLICGFHKPQDGSFSLNGENLDSMSIKERAEHIGYVMQNPNQMISKSMIYDEVALALVMDGEDPEFTKERVHSTLKICGLYPFRNWPISALSFGQKKRVTIASILSMQPDIIILDEPTAGQDFRHYTEIMEFLLKLNRQGTTIIMITHDMHLMIEYCERAVVFSDGQIIADAPCSDILTNKEIVEKASLKETSLSCLAEMCSLDSREFIRSFIRYDREVRQP